MPDAAASPADTPAFLGVDRSLTGRRWIGPDPGTDRLGQAIAQTAGLPALVGTVLARRGVAPHEAAAYLSPLLRDLMPNPSTLRDMDVAATRLVRAVTAGERIAIFADYDVDGGSAAALLIWWLRALGRTATLYIPDRIDEGYGPNVPAMQALGREHDLILCVDCGTLSHEPIAAAGCDVVVVDHHLGGETLPPACAVVNPNRHDETGDLAYLCAAGVVFLLLVAANRELRASGAEPPQLLPLLDLVALATVADVAPLTGLNRALVRQGLAVMSRLDRPGLRALAEVAGVSGVPGTYHLGFLLGPRVNAGGRIGAADLGARLLATDDPHEAAALAERLEQLNADRRTIEARVLAEAMAQAETRGAHSPLVWAAGTGWHPGVVGIVAARLKEAFRRPAVVIGLDAGIGKGSGRSIEGVDLGAAVATLAREGLIERGGGHRMAAGLTLAEARLSPAMDRLATLLDRQGAGREGPRTLQIDGVVAPVAAKPALLAALEDAGPYGAGSPAPRVAMAGLRIAQARRAGENHLSLALADAAGGRIAAIAFRAFDGPLGPALEAATGRAAHLAGRLELDDWGGRQRVKLRIDDAALSG